MWTQPEPHAARDFSSPNALAQPLREHHGQNLTLLACARNAIDNWFLPLQNAIMTTKLTLDKAGRVVLPKPIRDRLQLAPGDTLHLESEGDRITLRPVRQNVMLKKELGVWVYQGEPTDTSIPDLIERDRENRNRSVTESDIE
jgi:AbrB family looped-hinge helix DNA binding protein